MPELNFAYEGHLGGCVLPSEAAPNGDPATWAPEVWDWLLRLGDVKTVLDVGCGAGFATKYFSLKEGIEAFGIEGCQEAIDQAVTRRVIKHDFRDGPCPAPLPPDLVWCCEVAEHIDPECEEAFLATLTQGRVIAMTHGLPGQGGHHHVNLQYPSYWIARLQQRGYELDVALTRQCRMIDGMTPGVRHFGRTGLIFRQVAAPDRRHDDALLTWASGDQCCDSPEMSVFLNTLRKNFQGEKVVFTSDMNLDAREKFQDAGFEIIDVDPNAVNWVVRDRFKSYAGWIVANQGYSKIFLVDSRDILFLGDMNAWVDEYTKRQDGHQSSYLYLASEGHLHSQSPWNSQDQANIQRNLSPELGVDFCIIGWAPVLNGGFQVGTPDLIEMLCRELYSLSEYAGRPAVGTDQAALNWFYMNVSYRLSGVKVIDPTKDNLILHGEPIHTGVVPPPDYKKYLVFHQWDRTGFKDEILALYGD